MEIKINNQSLKLKFAAQLTTVEYIKYMNSLSEGASNYEQLINYIAIVTGMTYNDAAMINISDTDIRRIIAYIGVVPGVNNFPEIDSFYYKRLGITLYKKSLNWRTLGARKMLEEKKIETQLEQAVYLLAVYISKDYDSDKVDLIYNELMDYDADKVFGFIVFFFKNLMNGTRQGKKYWLMRKLKAFISILILLRK